MLSNTLIVCSAGELVDKLLFEYVRLGRSWSENHLRFSPTVDYMCGNAILQINRDRDGNQASIGVFFDNENDFQVEGKRIFDSSLFGDFNPKLFRAGAVYQLTIAAVYLDSNGEYSVSFPQEQGDWSEWENYYQTNIPSFNCVLRVAVKLLKGERVQAQRLRQKGVPQLLQVFSINVSSWMNRRSTVIFARDPLVLYRVVPNINEPEWITCAVHPVEERTNGVVFECSTVPENMLTFSLFAEEVYIQ